MENPAIKNGVFMGVTYMLFIMILYFINPSYAIGPVSWIGFLITIYFTFKAGKEERAINGGYLTFGEGLKATFLTIIVGYLIGSIFLYVLTAFIDPGLEETARQMALDMSNWIIDVGNVPEEQAEEMIDRIEAEDYSASLSTTLLGYLFNLIIPGFILSLIISAIVKKQDKSFA